MTDQRFQILASEHRQAEDRRIVAGKVMGRRHVVILQHATRAKPRELRRHRRHQREVKDRQVAAPRPCVGPRNDIVAEVVVDGHRVELGLMAHLPEQRAHPASRVANGVTLVRRRHPLIDDH
jgi:hypothetical protein